MNHVAENMKNAGKRHPESQAERRHASNSLQRIRHEDAKLRRELQKEEKEKRMILHLHRWSLIHNERVKAHEYVGELLEIRRWAQEWGKKVQVYNILVQMYQIHVQRVHEHKLRELQKRASKTIGLIWRLRVLKKGSTFAKRMSRMGKHQLTFFANMGHQASISPA